MREDTGTQPVKMHIRLYVYAYACTFAIHRSVCIQSVCIPVYACGYCAALKMSFFHFASFSLFWHHGRECSVEVDAERGEGVPEGRKRNVCEGKCWEPFEIRLSSIFCTVSIFISRHSSTVCGVAWFPSFLKLCVSCSCYFVSLGVPRFGGSVPSPRVSPAFAPLGRRSRLRQGRARRGEKVERLFPSDHPRALS